MLDIFLSYINRLDLTAVIDILLVTAVIFGALWMVRGTRAMQMLRGFISFALIATLLASMVDLPASSWFFNQISPVLLFSIPVIFQPELRRALEKLGGQTGSIKRLWRRRNEDVSITASVQASSVLSQRLHGALIVFERDTGLQEYVDSGILLEAEPSAELLQTIFNKTTELHDGAVIIRDQKVAAAGCVMPLTSSYLKDRQLGLRHRAALGITEVSDAIVIIVSEETGHISVVHDSTIMQQQESKQLTLLLRTYMQGKGGDTA